MKEFALTDTDPMPWGKHKGTPMQDVSPRYLHWLWTNGKEDETDYDSVAAYIEKSLDALKMEYPDGIW